MHLKVKPHHPWKSGMIWLLVLVFLFIGGWTLFEYGRFLAGFDKAEAFREREQLLDIKEDLEQHIVDLREQKAFLERAAQIERQAYDELDSTLKVLQAEILELKEELAFYRGIVSPRDASRGLQVQKFSIEPNGPRQSFHYKVVLTQVLKNDRQATGKVKLLIDGRLHGEPKLLSLKDVTDNSVKDLSYKFKYFQNLEGDIELPESYTPLRATMQILPRGRQRDMIEKTIEWTSEEITTDVGQKQETEADSSD